MNEGKWRGVSSAEMLEISRTNREAVDGFRLRYRNRLRGMGLWKISLENNQALSDFLHDHLDDAIEDTISDVLAGFMEGRVNHQYVHPYIMKAFYNRMSNLKRTWFRKFSRIERATDDTMSTDFADSILEKVNKEVVWELLDRSRRVGVISDKSHRIIIHFYREQWSFPEIAMLLQIPDAESIGDENARKLKTYLLENLKGEIDDSLL